MIQFEFDKEKLINKNLTMIKIYNIIMNNFISKKNVNCIVNDDNSSNLTMLIRVKEIDEETDYLEFLKELEKKILSITLHGIDGILYSDIKNQNSIFILRKEHLSLSSSSLYILLHPIFSKILFSDLYLSA